MSRRPNYIPRKADDFNKFQNDLLAAMVADGAAWGITATQIAVLTTWSTDYALLYAKVSNKDRRTREDLDNYRAFLVGYIAFLRVFVQSSLVNNPLIPIGRRGSLGLNPRGLSPRQPKEEITTVPLISLSPLGGGMIRFNFKVDEASKIAHMHPDSNGIAIYYRFSTIGKPAPVPPPQTNGLGAPVGNTLQDEEENNMDDEATDRAENGLPTADGYQLYVSTKAQFSRQFALEDIGKVLHIYAQWINSSKPQNNGNFSMVSSSLIS